MQLLPGEALALMNKIVLDDDLLSKMGVDKDDVSMVTGVKFMMVDTGMDEETVRLVSVGSFSNELLCSKRGLFFLHLPVFLPHRASLSLHQVTLASRSLMTVLAVW